MALAAGTKLGAYEILGEIGAGGFGAVYKARDTRLNRTVAIKVLSGQNANNAESRQRFEREAQTIAGLKHPHICVLYDVGRQNDADFLVMEYIEGETLAQRLTRGPLPLDPALKVAVEIADALDKAHRQGVTHRDLKPGNIMLTKSGAKLLDFGLAKLKAAPSPDMQLSSMPTGGGAAELTAQGTILGTLQYMPPEQLEGKDADARTDIFAFGAMLYEMLTGRKAFEGKSQVSLISAIMNAEPPAISTLQPMTPPALERAVKRSLAKDPDDRWQSANDLCSELRWIADGGSQAGTLPSPAAGPRRRGEHLARIGMALFALAFTSIAIVHFREKASAEMRLEIVTPATQSPMGFALSPDGGSIVFVADGDSHQQGLWLRRLDKTEAQLLPGTEDAQCPFWSPDGRSIGFLAAGKLKRLDVAGGRPTTLADDANPFGGSWGADGTILLGRPSGGLAMIAASGGQLVSVTKTKANETAQFWPQFLPDGKEFLYFLLGNAERQGIYLGFLDGSPAKRLAAADSAAAFLPPDRLIFVEQGALVARRFDLKRWELVGDPEILSDSAAWNGIGQAGFAVSAGGQIAYRTGGQQRRQLTWLDKSGTPAGAAGEMDMNSMVAPKLSPDGRRAAIDRTVQGNRDVFLMDLVRGGLTRFTFDPSMDGYPVWSPDGTQIAFESNRKDGVFHIYVKPANGSGSEQPLLELPGSQWPLDWSEDGWFLLYFDIANGGDLWALPVSGSVGSDRKPIVIAATPFNERTGAFSPDSRWVAYASNESGRFEVFVQAFPNPNGRWQISTAGGAFPRWSANGKELYFISPDFKMMASEVRISGAAIDAGAPVALFQTRIAAGDSGADYNVQYAVSPDGRFLINQSLDDSAPAPITLILNWRPKAEK